MGVILKLCFKTSAQKKTFCLRAAAFTCCCFFIFFCVSIIKFAIKCNKNYRYFNQNYFIFSIHYPFLSLHSFDKESFAVSKNHRTFVLSKRLNSLLD